MKGFFHSDMIQGTSGWSGQPIGISLDYLRFSCGTFRFQKTISERPIAWWTVIVHLLMGGAFYGYGGWHWRWSSLPCLWEHSLEKE